MPGMHRAVVTCRATHDSDTAVARRTHGGHTAVARWCHRGRTAVLRRSRGPVILTTLSSLSMKSSAMEERRRKKRMSTNLRRSHGGHTAVAWRFDVAALLRRVMRGGKKRTSAHIEMLRMYTA